MAITTERDWRTVTSPSTGSTDEMIATASATRRPRIMCGRHWMLAKRRCPHVQAVRLGRPVADDVAAELAAGLSTATYTSPTGTLKPSVNSLKWWISASIDSSMRARGGGVTFLSWMR